MVALPESGRQPVAGRVPEPSLGGPNDQLDLSVAQIAVMWILHYGTSPPKPQRTLTRDIVEFYPVALDVILRAEIMRGAKQSDLRLIYFKGLIVAQTHPKPQMVDAIRRADRALESVSTSVEQPDASARRSPGGQPSEDQDTLAHISDALGRPSRSSY
ncbi:hypothetical protein [Rhodopseudomonas sp. RCAM05734]|uniref:hypothetical protein n=1 Tax=Rhodopseudomonas sp. RCAM05734 TaxID=3457549 RepID=UPI004043C78C